MCVKFILLVYFSYLSRDGNIDTFLVIHWKMKIQGLCCLLCFQVVVGQEFVVPPYSQASLLQQPVEEDSDEELEYADSTSGIAEFIKLSTVPRDIYHYPLFSIIELNNQLQKLRYCQHMKSCLEVNKNSETKWFKSQKQHYSH